MKITLSKRLKAIADYVPQGARVADVGTDHGCIPAYLVQNGVCPSAIASDIREGPLHRAVVTAVEAEVADKLDFRLCPGLEGYGEDDADCIIIAGMGGGTIINVLEAEPWAKEKRLILQPQTKHHLLRGYLAEKGFLLSEARLAMDSGRLYIIYVADGEAPPQELSYTDCCIDMLLIKRRDTLLGAFAEMLTEREKKRLRGLEASQNPDSDEIGRLHAAINTFKKIKEMAGKWQL